MSGELELLSKITVGGQELKNRMALAPMTRARCTPGKDALDPSSRIPNDIMGDYYEQRASAGLVITEGTEFSEESFGWANSPMIETEEQAEAWKKITDRVHAKDGIIYCQLWHLGRQSHSSFHPTTNRIVSASDIPMNPEHFKAKTAQYTEDKPEVPVPMTVEDIQRTIADYVNAAKMSKLAGFDGVEVHGANGYLLDQFLQSSTNKRDDNYGGSFENRFRFLKEVIEAIVDSGAYPAERIAVRISPNGVFGDMGSEDNPEMFTYVAAELNKMGLAYLHVMDGLGFGFHNKAKAVKCADLRKVFDGIIMCNINMTKDLAEGMIRSGAADMAAFGRLYISNPDLPERFKNNWPVADPAPYETWWQQTAEKGYTDWPTYTPKEGEEAK